MPDLRYFGQVDDFYLTFEWNEGGMNHEHMACWVVGAPRIDKIEVPRESKEEADVVEIEVSLPGASVVPQTEAADRLATFWDRAYTEFSVAKAMAVPGTASTTP